jgi:hypothetical protein
MFGVIYPGIEDGVERYHPGHDDRAGHDRHQVQSVQDVEAALLETIYASMPRAARDR